MILEQYRKAIDFLRSNIKRTYWHCLIVFVVILAVLAIVISLLDVDTVIQMYGSKIMDGLALFDTGSTAEAGAAAAEEAKTWGFYIRVNGESALTLLILGLIPFIPVGVISLLYNAVALGLMTGMTALLQQINPLLTFLIYVAPHGIAEYSNAVLQAALAIYMCRTVTRAILRKEHDNIKEAFLNVLRAWILIVIPVIIICGFIEANITPMVIAAFAG